MRIDDKSLWGNGAWVGSDYVLEKCPICDDSATFRFRGGAGMWACPSCDNLGTWSELKAILCKRDDWIDRISFLDDPTGPAGLIILSNYQRLSDPGRIGTGFGFVDTLLGGFSEGALTVLTGKRGEGKSTLAGQISLNAISGGAGVCFYSGELNAAMFQEWIFQQAAGSLGVEVYKDQFGATRYRAKHDVSMKIRRWLGTRFILSDSETAGANEHRIIFERFRAACENYGAKLFIVDNLMTTHFSGRSDDFYRRQSEFVGALVDFAQEQRAHIILVAHPRKGESGDENDQVAGISDITNRASNVIRVSKLKPEQSVSEECTNIISITKNREFGQTGSVRMDFDIPSRRFIQKGGTMITRYGWEDLR